MDQHKLKEILQKHSLWLRREDGGEKANLYNSDLSNCNLTGADLSSANLFAADLRGANLSSANLFAADLRSSDLRGADLSSANLRGANLFAADLSSANLRGADLSSTDLRNADLRNADLRDANLSSANLFAADLSYTDLRDAKNFFLLPVQDPRGYPPIYAILVGEKWQIRAGCRRFSIEQARAHWGESYQGERWIGDMYLHACDWLELMIANNKEVV